MKKKINTIDLVSFGLPAFAVLGIILRVIALFTAFDSDIGYFNSSSLITHIDRTILFVAIVFGIAVAIFTKKNALSVEPSPVTLWSTFASIVLGFIFAIFGLLFLLLNISKESILGYVVVVVALISAVYYIYEGFKPIKSGVLNAMRAIVAIVSAIGPIAIVFVENFDFYVTLNSPEKLLAMFSFAISPLFVIQKLKFGAGNPSPRFYLCTSYLTAFLGAYFSIPGIIANCAGVLDEPKYLLYYLLALGLAIYASTDLIGRIKLTRLSEAPITQTAQ